MATQINESVFTLKHLNKKKIYILPNDLQLLVAWFEDYYMGLINIKYKKILKYVHFH